MQSMPTTHPQPSATKRIRARDKMATTASTSSLQLLDLIYKGACIPAADVDAIALAEVEALAPEFYACGPLELAKKAGKVSIISSDVVALHRDRARKWAVETRDLVLKGELQPNGSIVAVMADIATGRVGGWLHPETRGAAWQTFAHIARTTPGNVPKATWQALLKEKELTMQEDIDGKFSSHYVHEEDAWWAGNIMAPGDVFVAPALLEHLGDEVFQ